MAKGGKRAGAGRPALAPKGQRTAILVRVDRKVRERLRRDAREHNRSLSGEVESLIKIALKFPDEIYESWRGAHLYAIGRLFAHAIWRVEAELGFAFPIAAMQWRDNVFAAQAVRVVIDYVLERLTPDGPLEIPEEIKTYAERMGRHLPPDQAALYSTPQAIGTKIGWDLMRELDTSVEDSREPLDWPDIDHANARHLMPRLRKDLGLDRKKEDSK